MKECPVCKATCFDDMVVCYGCLHRFDGAGEEDRLPAEKMSEALASSKSLQLSFGERGYEPDEPEREPLAERRPNVENLEMGVGQEVPLRARHAIATPSHLALSSKVPSPTDEPVDAVVIPGGQCGQDEWVLHVSMPAGCEGVTVRLARA